MEQQIFYWTGCVIWWGLCLMAIGGIIAMVIIAPVVAYKRAKKFFWQWKWAAEIGHTGITQDDVQFAIRTPFGTPNDASIEDMIDWYRKVKERFEAVPKEWD